VAVHLLLQVSPAVKALQVASEAHGTGVYVALEVVEAQSPTPVVVLHVLQKPELHFAPPTVSTLQPLPEGGPLDTQPFAAIGFATYDGQSLFAEHVFFVIGVAVESGH